MKQKYSIFIDKNADTMTIKEFAELDKGVFSLIFEETYENPKIQAAIKDGKEALISEIRTPNLYPIAEYVEEIADTVINQFENTPSEAPVELVFNDIRLMQKEKKADTDEDTKDEDAVEIDSLLENDDDDSSETEDSETKDDD
jgi:hypothetical protein